MFSLYHAIIRRIKNRSYKNQIVFILCLSLFGVICVVLITCYVHSKLLNDYVLTYCEQIVDQAGLQVENALHRMEISQNQILVSVSETALYDVNASDKQRYASGKDLLDKISIIKQLSRGDTTHYYLTADGTHPSDYGHMRMGAMLNQVFDSLLC